jgi:hypothetical protein
LQQRQNSSRNRVFYSLTGKTCGENMKKRLKRIFLFSCLSIVVVLCGQLNAAFARNTADNNAAIATVKSFYKFHRASKNIFNKTQVDARKRWFAPELYGLFNNELKLEKEFLKANPSEKPYFGDGFPFQPYDECFANNKSHPNVYKIGNADVRNNRALVEVKFYEPKICGGRFIDTYKIELVKSRGKWAIADWIYSNGNKLTTDIKTPHY